VPTKLIHYGDFIIRASYCTGDLGLMPTVVLSNEDGSSTVQLPHPRRGFLTEDEVFAAGIEYGKGVIDGGGKGIDLPKPSAGKSNV